MEAGLIVGATSCYAGAFAAMFAGRGRARWARWTLLILAAGLLCNTLAIGWRWAGAGRPPLASLYESFVFFAWALVSLGIIFELRQARAGVALLTSFLGAAALLIAGTFESTIEPLPPALRSIWLPLHVAACMVAYGAFAIGCVASARWLYLDRRDRLEDGAGRRLEATNAGTTAVGFIFLSLGILSGAVWANRTWGDYWGWDPKETWSLATWLVYAAALHLRYTGRRRPRQLCWFSVAGFGSVLFLYLGVTYLLPGLHGYAVE